MESSTELTSLPHVAVSAFLQKRGFRTGESLGRAWGGSEFFPKLWNSETCLGATERMLEEGTNGKHLEVTLTGRVCALPQQKPQSLSVERDRGGTLAEWFHPILAFLCLELRAHKNHSGNVS